MVHSAHSHLIYIIQYSYDFCRPNRNEVQDHYLDAMHAGGFGADCSDLYPKCSPGRGLLDSISYYF